MDAAALSISLVGVVFKFVVFSLDFVGDAKRVYKQGATDRNIDLSIVTKSVQDVTTGLVKQLDSFCARQALSPDEERLKELSLRAAEIGRELEQKLRSVTIDEKSKWKSFKAVAFGIWDANEMEKIEKRLNSIKDEIQLGILVSIREKVDQSKDEQLSRRLSALEEVAKQQATSKEDSKYMIEKLNRADEVGQERHGKVIELGNRLLVAINAISISRSPNPIPVHDELAHNEAEQTILDSLWYPSIRDREETISEAHRNTFQWVFEDPKTTGKSWDNFADFLKGNISTFWITGKPGSGKSTLMKFINESQKTEALLRQWARERTLLRISYYFYYNGGQYQKSELGMVRSLLHSILNQRRDLIPIAFENRFRAALKGKKYDDPSLEEMQRALKDLILRTPDLCFFFTIDGLDEFDPAVSRTRVQSLIDFTHSVEGFENVKMLVSSRPLPEFEHGYCGHPSLSVHHLTTEDIRRYANEKLMDHPQMKILSSKDPESTRDLLQSIVESSLGVFLWVRVVIESLQEGLTNYDTIDDLKATLNDLPSDLQDLYKTILSRIEPKRRPQTARLLCFLYHTHDDQELSVLDLWFAEKADDNMVRSAPVKPINDEEVRERVREVEALLKSRCLGLIETIPTKVGKHELGSYYVRNSPLLYDWSTNERKATARFLHRSMHEFLTRRDVWNEVVEKHLSHTFSVHLSLFRSAILIIKTCRLPRDTHWRVITHLAKAAGHRGRAAELETSQSHSDLVHQLDLAMHGIMPLLYRSAKAQNDGLSRLHSMGLEYHWSSWCRPSFFDYKVMTVRLEGECANGSLMVFAVEFGLKYYIRSQIASRGRAILTKAGMPLLGYALLTDERPRHETVKFLLGEGCKPNKLYGGITVWEWFLWLTPVSSRSFGDQDYFLVMEAMLLAGADHNARMCCGCDSTARSLDLEDVIRWQLPWHPPIPAGLPFRVCTVLFMLVQCNQWAKNGSVRTDRLKELNNQVEAIQRMIRFLEGKGALKQEWNDECSIKQIFLEVCERAGGNSQALTNAARVRGQLKRLYNKLWERLGPSLRRRK